MLVIMAINFFDYGNVMVPIMNKSSFAFTKKSSSSCDFSNIHNKNFRAFGIILQSI